QLNIDVIAHNLANANTTGYKRSRPNFEDLMYQTAVAPGAQTQGGTEIPTGIQVGLGSRTAAVQKVFAQGNFTDTSNPLDLAIEGSGFFKVLRNGVDEAYTRDGSFKLDKDGFVVNSTGDRLQPEVSIPNEAIQVTVEAGGLLSAVDQTGKVVVTAQLNLYRFTNEAGLVSTGKNLFIPSDSSGEAREGTPGQDGFGTMMQGYLESSNISVVEEMVNMIAGQRAYEASSKTIKTSDEMLQMANNVKA
ncbi:MAG TPA: flagellar basal-body rod protein FlgG, partial [Syntrophobacteraceae bacterium]|nr:flagellar basal-body rod protein FlgG [Syntrophobacteraceae bacterium]